MFLIFKFNCDAVQLICALLNFVVSFRFGFSIKNKLTLALYAEIGFQDPKRSKIGISGERAWSNLLCKNFKNSRSQSHLYNFPSRSTETVCPKPTNTPSKSPSNSK